ncbi:DUF7683 domain-containing protein [Mesorhizobium quangtriensis]|uniref:DUF7683 domain-containing protein n=1 Tax=Mesorhizobium quangtriensis TaxID=3157709 RepID=UPI003CCD9D25
MIYPPPSGYRESDLPEGAIDRVTCPPYRLVWSLEVFDKTNESLVAEVILEHFDVKVLKRLFRRPPSDPMVGGVWPVTGKHRRQIEALTGQKLDHRRYTYFIGASALNYSEVNR